VRVQLHFSFCDVGALKNILLLENYYSPAELTDQIDIFIEHYNLKTYITIAERILTGEGYTKVKYMDGDIICWPFEKTINVRFLLLNYTQFSNTKTFFVAWNQGSAVSNFNRNRECMAPACERFQ